MRKDGSIHYATYGTSERLQRVLMFLLDGKEHTTLEIIEGAEVCAVNSAICELRRNGFSVACVKKSRPAVYQVADPEADRRLSRRLLAEAMRLEGTKGAYGTHGSHGTDGLGGAR